MSLEDRDGRQFLAELGAARKKSEDGLKDAHQLIIRRCRVLTHALAEAEGDRDRARAERDEARAVVREMCRHLVPVTQATEDRWMQRAGTEDVQR